VDGIDLASSITVYDAHTADSTIHFTEGSIDHTAITNIGTNSHAVIDSHIADATLHFTEASIDHGSIAGLGDDDHTQYLLATGTRDADLLTVTGTLGVSGATQFGSTLSGTGNITTLGDVVVGGLVDGIDLASSITVYDAHTADSTIHFTEGSIDHTAITNITNIGTNSHAVIDSHIADATLHFTEASIDHGSIAGLADDDHPQYLLSATYDLSSANFQSAHETVLNNSGSWGGAAPAVSGRTGITLESPVAADDFVIFRPEVATTINKMVITTRGSSTPSVTVDIRHAADRSAAGTALITSPTASTEGGNSAENTGREMTSEHVWIEFDAVSGTVDEVHVELHYSID
jgi:hypothetical protein